MGEREDRRRRRVSWRAAGTRLCLSAAAVLLVGAAGASASLVAPSLPGSSQPGSSQPGSSQPGSSQPGSSQPGSSQPTSSQPTSSPRASRTTITLSNETTFSQWATPVRRGAIRRAPSSAAPRIAALRLYTEDGFDEVYLLLRSVRNAAGEWVEMRVPGRPNGTIGWVPRSSLGAFHVVRRVLVVDRKRLRITLFVRGRNVWSAPVGIGKPSTPTPGGHFWIREIFRLPRDPLYGPFAFGTADYSVLTDWPGGGIVGIHGPYGAPQDIPGRPSHGCMRLRTVDDRWLGRHLPVGTPLLVR